MRPDLAALPPRYLRTKEAADFLSLSARTLEKHRTEPRRVCRKLISVSYAAMASVSRAA